MGDPLDGEAKSPWTDPLDEPVEQRRARALARIEQMRTDAGAAQRASRLRRPPVTPGTPCPYCGVRVRGTAEEVAHMERFHPDIVASRLRAIGAHDEAEALPAQPDTLEGLADLYAHDKIEVGELERRTAVVLARE